MPNEITLQERSCAAKGCTGKFKVISTSKKMGCSLFCEQQIDPSKFVNGLPRRGAFKSEPAPVVEPKRAAPKFLTIVPDEYGGQLELTVED